MSRLNSALASDQVAMNIDNDGGYVDPLSLKQQEELRESHEDVRNFTPTQTSRKKRIIEWLCDNLSHVLNWTTSISALISLILKVPFLVWLTQLMIEMIKARIKKATEAKHRAAGLDPYEEEPTNNNNSAQSTKGLMIEVLVFVLLLVAVIMVQFLVFITHLISSSKCCRKAQNSKVLLLSFYLVFLASWMLVYTSSYFLEEWPYLGGGVFMMFKLLIHGNSLTGTPDNTEVSLMKNSFFPDLISLIAVIALLVIQVFECCKRFNSSDSNRRLTGSKSSGKGSPLSNNNRRMNRQSSASGLKWYTINCGCFTLFDGSPDHEKMKCNSSCSSNSDGFTGGREIDGQEETTSLTTGTNSLEHVSSDKPTAPSSEDAAVQKQLLKANP